MGLFNRKHQDGRQEEEHSVPAREEDHREEVPESGEEAPRAEHVERAERPTEPLEAAVPAPAPEPDPIAAELRDLDASVGAAKPKPAKAEQPDAAKPEEPSTGSLDKDDLRRAVKSASSPEPDPDEGRRSAEEIMAPTMRRRHPFTPEAIDEPGDRRMKVFAFANQKGGVAKTTTTLNLAVALSESGHRVLCVDLDPQGNLTMSQGIDPGTVEKSLYHVLVERMPIKEIIQHREVDIAVASIDLAGAEIAMSTQIGRERSLQKALATISDEYDYVCIDTPPSLGLLTINALTAADKVIVPVQCEYLSMRGLVQLQNTLEMIRENLNPDVQIEGILPTMLDTRTIHAKEAVEILEENFGDLVFKSRIRKAIKFAEAPVKGSSVLKYDPQSNAAQCYRDLAEEVLTHGAST
jgi:chromosome partitioning protein